MLFSFPLRISYYISYNTDGISQARILEWVAISYSRGIFTTQESNLGRRITPGFFTD